MATNRRIADDAETKANEYRTGWPRAVARPRLPQTRTCAINAFGSSSYPVRYAAAPVVDSRAGTARDSESGAGETSPTKLATPAAAA